MRPIHWFFVAPVLVALAVAGFMLGNLSGPSSNSAPGTYSASPGASANPSLQPLSALDPPPVSLHIKNADLTELAAQLASLTGANITANPNPNVPASFSLDVDNKSFWEVFQLLDRQGHLNFNDTFGNTFRLLSNPGDPYIEMISIHGPFVLLTRTRPSPSANSLQFTLAADPRLAPLAYLLRWTVIDAAGLPFDMPSTDPTSLAGGPVPIINPHSVARVLNLQTFFDSRPDASIISLKAHARIIVGFDFASTEIKDAQNHLNTSFPVGKATITVTKLDVNGTRGLSIAYQVTDDNGPVPNTARIIDSTGKVLIANKTSGSANITIGSSSTAPFDLEVRVPQQTKEFEFDFELKPPTPITNRNK